MNTDGGQNKVNYFFSEYFTIRPDPRLDAERVGMWGVSLGGTATMFWTPLEPRIKAAVVCAWFNHRCNKMAVPDPRYSCFLETLEEHAFFRGWLTAGFS